jgi:hypothetical protein
VSYPYKNTTKFVGLVQSWDRHGRDCMVSLLLLPHNGHHQLVDCYAMVVEFIITYAINAYGLSLNATINNISVIL